MTNTNKDEKRLHSKWVFDQHQSLYFQLMLMFYNAKPRITESQINFLIYLFLYGDTFKERLIEDGKFLSIQAIKNAQSILLRSKLIVIIPDAKVKNLAYVYDIQPRLRKALILGDLEYIISIRVQ